VRRTGDLKLIQELNRFIVLNTIREDGPISRSEIARNNNISPTTVTSAVKGLIMEGLVTENGTGVSRGGRKPILLRFSPDNHFIIGVSISNSMITIARMNLEAEVREKKTYFIKKLKGQSVIDYLLLLIDQFLNLYIKTKNKCIGISVITQGVVDYANGEISYNPKLKLKNIRLKKLIENKFSIETWVENDTNAYIIAEKSFGSFRDYENILYVTIGEGLGAGIVINGLVNRGSNGAAGEFGHTSISKEGIKCECGNVGCLENYVSWPAMYSRVVSSIVKGKYTEMIDLADGNMEQISPFYFNKALDNNDELAVDVIQEIASYLSTGLINLAHLFNPEIIIIGGETVYQNNYFIELINKKVRRGILDVLNKDIQIQPSSLGEEYEMIGASSVLLHDMFQFKLHHQTKKVNT